MRPRSPLSDGLLDSLSSVCAHGWCVMGGDCLSRTLGASLLLYDVVNRAKSDVQVAYANMKFL